MNFIVGINGGAALEHSTGLIREFVSRGASLTLVVSRGQYECLLNSDIREELRTIRCITDISQEEQQYGPLWHEMLAAWCNSMLIAPCSATSLARIAHGFADTPLATLAHAVLGKRKPLLLAYIFDLSLEQSPAMSANCRFLIQHGCILIPPRQMTATEAPVLDAPFILTDAAFSPTSFASEVANRFTRFRYATQGNTDNRSAPPLSPEVLAQEQIRRAIETPLTTPEESRLSDTLTAEVELEMLKQQSHH